MRKNAMRNILSIILMSAFLVSRSFAMDTTPSASNDTSQAADSEWRRKYYFQVAVSAGNLAKSKECLDRWADMAHERLPCGELPIMRLMRHWNNIGRWGGHSGADDGYKQTLTLLLNSEGQNLEEISCIELITHKQTPKVAGQVKDDRYKVECNAHGSSFEGDLIPCGRTFLQEAIISQNMVAGLLFLEHGADINNPGLIGKTPLYLVLEDAAGKRDRDFLMRVNIGIKKYQKSNSSAINTTSWSADSVIGAALSVGKAVMRASERLMGRTTDCDEKADELGAEDFEKKFFAFPQCAQSNIYLRPLRSIREKNDPKDFTNCIMSSVYDSFSAHPEIIKIDNKNVRNVRTILLLFKELGARAVAAAGNQEETVISGGPAIKPPLFPTEICHHIIRDAIDFGGDFLKCKVPSSK